MTTENALSKILFVIFTIKEMIEILLDPSLTLIDALGVSQFLSEFPVSLLDLLSIALSKFSILLSPD